VLIPGLPGIKPGLANVFSLFALVSLGVGSGFAVVALRCLLAGALWGQPISLAYSLAGGMLSTLIMWGMLKLSRGRLSLYGISVGGAFFHNVGQLCVAALILQSGYVFGYLPIMTAMAVPAVPIMTAMAVPAGLFVGLVTGLIKKALDKTELVKGLGE